MDNHEHWEDIAQYDLETAKAMLSSGRFLCVVFMCQQSIEKIIKGLFVLHKGEEAPRTHNINLIFRSLFEDSTLIDAIARQSEYASFFIQLHAYYISERYPSYREKLSSTINQELAEEVLEKTEEVFAWLQSLAKFK